MEEPTNNHKAAKWIANKEPLPYYRVTQNYIPLNRKRTFIQAIVFLVAKILELLLTLSRQPLENIITLYTDDYSVENKRLLL